MFRDLIENMARMLEERGIAYMLIGGQAVLLYGEPRATKDIDIIIQKVIAGRPRDLEDVKIILAKNPKMDIPYIHSWLKQFSESLAQPFLKTFDEIHKQIQ
jgi:hypothetical protein